MYVYWWHVRGLNAVKVGHAEDPRQHVSDYRRDYGLGGKEVRGYRLDGSMDPEWVERQLGRMLETWGLERIVLESEDGDEEEGFFALDGSTFEEINERLRHAARHVVLAEVSNRRKQEMRQALQEAAQEAAAPRREPEPEPRPPPQPQPQPQPQPERRHEEPPPTYPPVSSPFSYARAAQAGVFLVTAIVAWGLVADFMGVTVDGISAGVSEPAKPSVASIPPDGGSAVARAPKSDQGRSAGASVETSAPARKVVAPPEPEPSLPQSATLGPEPPPQPTRSAVPPTPATLPAVPEPPVRPAPSRAQPAAPRPAAAQAQTIPEMAPARAQCSVSRPQPGFQVYLVTCPDSQVTIGRTVDSPGGWTVSESVNGDAAIEFFMKSRYAR
ncbi:MAG: hypothetical protein KIS73_12965 [Enhydrobacter sp.]|nr:hypothetical protein [Enhydrobacter sp.]